MAKYRIAPQRKNGYIVIIDEDGNTYKDVNGNEVFYDDISDAKRDCGTLNYPDTQWDRYLKYLMMWILDHQNEYNEGMSPVGYDEFCDNDDDAEYYEEQLNYSNIERDCKEMIKRWRGWL